MANIAARWRAGRQPEDADVPMEDSTDDDTVLPSSSSSAVPPSSFAVPPPFTIVPPSPVHYTMTIGEARAHYMDMVWEEREERFREVQADVAYNHALLQEHLQAEEQLVAGRTVTPDADLAEHEALLDSFRSAREIRLAR